MDAISLELDRFLEEHDRGVILLRAEAGLGKSTLAAKWAHHRAGFTDAVLCHAFSVRERASSTRADMVESLVRQTVISLGPDELGEGEPGDEKRLANRLATLLARDQPPGTRLMVVLDALDEAAERIEPWSTDIGRGVYILATCRAEPDETPPVLRAWHERYRDTGVLEDLLIGQELRLQNELYFALLPAISGAWFETAGH